MKGGGIGILTIRSFSETKETEIFTRNTVDEVVVGYLDGCLAELEVDSLLLLLVAAVNPVLTSLELLSSGEGLEKTSNDVSRKVTDSCASVNESSEGSAALTLAGSDAIDVDPVTK